MGILIVSNKLIIRLVYPKLKNLYILREIVIMSNITHTKIHHMISYPLNGTNYNLCYSIYIHILVIIHHLKPV